jgi:hypothetical protein
LNPRGTHAPIRFRVGRLQPGSATPPRQSQPAAYLESRLPRSGGFPHNLLDGVGRVAGTQIERGAAPCSGSSSRRAYGPFASLLQPPPNGKRRCAGARARSRPDAIRFVLLGRGLEEGLFRTVWPVMRGGEVPSHRGRPVSIRTQLAVSSPCPMCQTPLRRRQPVFAPRCRGAGMGRAGRCSSRRSGFWRRAIGEARGTDELSPLWDCQ